MRVAADYRKRAHRRYESPSDDLPEPSGPANQHAELEDHQARALLDATVRTLDDDKRAVFVLCDRRKEGHVSKLEEPARLFDAASSTTDGVRRVLRSGQRGLPGLSTYRVTARCVEPGGTFKLEWNGLVYAKATLPDGCPTPADPQSLECYQGNAPKIGMLDVRVDLSPTAMWCGVGMQSCTATGDVFHATKSFMYPGEAQVDVEVN